MPDDRPIEFDPQALTDLLRLGFAAVAGTTPRDNETEALAWGCSVLLAVGGTRTVDQLLALSTLGGPEAADAVRARLAR
jgi:hypothetical protein